LTKSGYANSLLVRIFACLDIEEAVEIHVRAPASCETALCGAEHNGGATTSRLSIPVTVAIPALIELFVKQKYKSGVEKEGCCCTLMYESSLSGSGSWSG
jgi:hypothetical protein